MGSTLNFCLSRGLPFKAKGLQVEELLAKKRHHARRWVVEGTRWAKKADNSQVLHKTSRNCHEAICSEPAGDPEREIMTSGEQLLFSPRA